MEKAMSKSLTSIDVKEMVERIKQFLAAWLVGHIMKMGREYAEYIRKNKK